MPAALPYEQILMSMSLKIRHHGTIIRRVLFTILILLQRVLRLAEIVDHAETCIPVALRHPLGELIHGAALQHLAITQRIVCISCRHGRIIRMAESILPIDVQAVKTVLMAQGSRVVALVISYYATQMLLQRRTISIW